MDNERKDVTPPQGGTQPGGKDRAPYREDGDPALRQQAEQGTHGIGTGKGQQGQSGEGRRDQGNNGQAMNDQGNSSRRGDNGRAGESDK